MTLNSFQESIKQSMLHYPTLYEEKWQVCSHMFATLGNGYGWVDGRLVSESLRRRVKMKLDKERMVERFEKEMPGYKMDDDRRALLNAQDDAFIALAKIREKHIDAIARSYCNQLFMSRKYRLTELDGYMGEYACYPNRWEGGTSCTVPAFNYPENIQPDWAAGLLDFVDFWLEAQFRLGKNLKNYEPLRQALREVQNDLNIRVHGKDTKQLRAERDAFLSRVMPKILKEEENS